MEVQVAEKFLNMNSDIFFATCLLMGDILQFAFIITQFQCFILRYKPNGVIFFHESI